MNIITGIFVNESIETAGKDHDLIVQMEVLRTRQMLCELQRLFEEIDGDADGSITLEEFENALRDPQGSVRGVFKLLDIDITDARDFFSVIDVDGSNRIEIDEFVMGCRRLEGNGHHLGLESVMQEHRKRLKDINRRQERVEVKLHSIIDEMKGIRAMWDRNSALVIRSEDGESLKTRGRSFSM
uniref:EF-hand domain-containing protein n=1 Tax=Noctiluca scintillans TaxID=2966 RepID=A0A7S1AU49_NOCSC